MNDVADTLRKARDLIAEPERWTQHALARDADCFTVSAISGSATCWCSSGALLRAANGCIDLWREAIGILDNMSGEGIEVYNDAPERTHAEVLAAFDRAIAAAEAAP